MTQQKPATQAVPSLLRARERARSNVVDSAQFLQCQIGNRAMNRLIQAKLIVGPADDPYEREAERVAAQVASGGVTASEVSALQEPAEVQAMPAAPAVGPAGGEAPPEVARALAANRGAGAPLPEPTRATMEQHFGADLSAVRVHTGPQAEQLNRQLGAQAFTWGNDIYMGAGKYNPATQTGQRLLAHELTHVVQQAGGARRQVRRLMASTLLKELAGEARADVKLGKLTLRKMSTAYKAVLQAIDAYHGKVGSIPAAEMTNEQLTDVYAKLTALEQACRAYINKHPTGSRTPHIQAVLDDIPNERAAIQQIADNRAAYPYTLRNAIERVRNQPVITQATGMMNIAAGRNLREANQERQGSNLSAVADAEGAIATAALQSYTADMDRILAGDQKNKGRAPTAFDWRGNTATTKLASGLGMKVGQDYFARVIAPELSQALSLPDALAEVDPQRVADPAKLQSNIARMQGVYGSFMLLFTAQGAAKVPLPLARFCAELYALALRKNMSAEQAYLLVSSQLFLRTINPMLTNTAASLTDGKPGKRALVILSKLVQDDANNVDHGGKEPFMAVFNGVFDRQQIQEFVEAVIARGRS